MQLALHTSKPPNFSMLIPNLQKLKITNNGVVASPHLKSMQLQAKKTKRRQDGSKHTLHTLSSHGWSENRRDKAQKEPNKTGKQGERV